MSGASSMSGGLAHGLTVTTARGHGLMYYANPARMIENLWSRRGLIWQMTLRDLKMRNRGTHLGSAWAVITPLLLLGVYTLVFSTILSVRFSRSHSESVLVYAVTLFTGMMVFSMFAEPLHKAPMLVAGKANFVKKMVFPIEILPVTSVLATMIYSGAALVLTIGAHVLLGGKVTPWMLAWPVVLVPLVLTALGIGWLFAALGVFIQDLQHLSAVLVQRVLFFLTPIFYPIEAVSERYRWILNFNPMAGVVDGSRRMLLWGSPPDWAVLGAWSAIGAAFAIFGYAVFMKARRGFADVM